MKTFERVFQYFWWDTTFTPSLHPFFFVQGYRKSKSSTKKQVQSCCQTLEWYLFEIQIFPEHLVILFVAIRCMVTHSDHQLQRTSNLKLFEIVGNLNLNVNQDSINNMSDYTSAQDNLKKNRNTNILFIFRCCNWWYTYKMINDMVVTIFQ